MAIRNTLIDAYGLNSPGKNLLEHAGNHDYSGFNPANQTQNIQVNHDNINNYIHITQNSDSRVGAYRYVNNIEPGKIYNLSFYVYSEYSGTLRNCFETSTEIYGSNLTFNSNEWNKCWVTSKAVSKNIVFYVQNTSFKIRNIKLTECTEKDCYFSQYTDINDELKPFVYNFKDLQTNCRYTEYFTDDNPINELISWENFKYLLKEFVEYEEWQYSDDKSYRTRNTTSIIDWCDGSNKSSVSNTEREDATIEYGTPELTLVVDDIPASGGTISDGTVSYGQSKYYVYSDTRFKVTDESGVITEGLTWGDSVTAQSLGTTIKDRSVVGSLSVSTTINGKTESTTVDVYQQANRIESYGIPTGRTLSVSDIPASGGTISRGTLGGTITQSCTYTSGSNGSLTNPTITSSSYSSSITADSLGTTIKGRTKIGTLIYSYVCNKRTGSVSADVYQQANEATDITYGDWSVSLSANKYTTSSSPAPAGGGTVAITSSASRSRIQNYTSGDTSTLSNETATPTLSISGTGFSLSGTTVTVNNRSNVEGGQRTASVTATISGVTKSITLYQALNTITSIALYMSGPTPSPPMTDYPASGSSSGYVGIPTYSSGASGRMQNFVDYVSYSFSESWGRWEMSQDGYWGNLFVSSRGTVAGAARSGELTCTISGTINGVSVNVSGNLTITQAANTQTAVYDAPMVTLVVSDIPASGGTISSGTVTYSQKWRYSYTSGSVSEQTAKTSGGSVSYSTEVSAPSLGTTVKSRTSIGTLTATVAMNGKSGSGSATVYQAANAATTISYGSWVVTVSSNKYASSSAACPASGGSATITRSASRTRTQNYTSGATSALSAETATPTLSISGAGFTLSGTTVTVANRTNVIGKARTATVTATHSGVSKSITLYQAANTVTSIEIRSCGGATDQPTVSYPASGAGYCFSFSCRFSSGLDQEDSVVDGLETWSFDQSWGTWAATSENRWWGTLTIPSRGTTIGASRSGTLTCTLKGTINGVSINASDSVTITQAENTVTSSKIVPMSGSASDVNFPASGASKGFIGELTLSSGAKIQGADYKNYITYSLTSSFGTFTPNAEKYYGIVTVASRGATIGVQKSGTLTHKISGTINGVSINKTATLGLTQALNTITSLTMMSGINIPVTTNYTAAGGKNTYTMDATYSSGSRAQAGSILASYIDYSFNQSWGTWADLSSGYYGSLTVASRGTTIGAARSGVLTGKLIGTINGVSINKTATATLTQALNKVVSCTETNNTLSYPSIAAGGGTSTPSGMTTARFTYSSGASGDPEGYVWTKSFSMTSGNGFSINTSSGVVTATNNTTTSSRTSNTITRAAKISYTNPASVGGDTVSATLTKTATCTQSAGAKTYANPVVSLSYATIPAKGGTVSPTLSYSQTWGWNGATSGGGTITSGATVSYSGTSVNATNGSVTASSKGTTVSNVTTVTTATATVKLNGKTGTKSATVQQALNKITTLAIIPSAGATDTTSYPTGNFAASGGTKTPTTSARVVGTFSSGSQGYTGAEGAWYGGTLTISRAWSMAAATGFSMNTSTGAVTASNRGTTVGAARTCNPKCVVSASFTNPSSVGGGVVKASSITDSFTLTQAANSMTREYSNLVGHISSTTWANKANYTSFWATGDYIERYTSGATGSSGSGDVPWDSVTVGGADWVYYDSVQGLLKWYDNTGLERSTTITGKIGSWTYSVKVTQKAGMTIGRLYLHVPVNVGYVEYWNIYVNSTSGGQIWSGNPEQYGSANNILKMPEECAIIVAQNGGTVSFSTTYSTATDRNYRGSISGTEQDRLADGEDVTVYLT